MKRGAEVNATTWRGDTALMLASMNGHADVVKLLISYKADVNAKNRDGMSVLVAALNFDHPDIVEMLKNSGATE